MRALERACRLIAPLVVAALTMGGGARADDTPQAQLQAIQKALGDKAQQQQNFDKQASSLAAEIGSLRDQEVAAAKSASAHEDALTRLESQLATLALDEKAASDELQRRRSEETALLTALLRLARNPPSGLALADGAPVDLLRGGILLGAAVPPLVERAERLSIELKTLSDLQDQIREAEARHRIEADALVKEEARITALVAQKSAIETQARQNSAQTAAASQQLASQAHDLQDLIERTEAAEKKRDADAAAARAHSQQGQEVVASAPGLDLADPSRPKSIRPFAQARGEMVSPAAGTIAIAFGAPDPAGGTAKGLTISTRAAAQVVAPYDGRVLFAGPFKGYGQILIIGHGDGYHSLVAGLDRVDAAVGQWVVAGEPIGVMPKGGSRPNLYLELRQNGEPINPLPWLATSDAKVKG